MPVPPSTARERPPRIGVLLVNLGTPAAPTAAALRRYLNQFLSDPRVVELPRWLWKPILWLLVLPLRPARSAAKYAAIWTPDGSPLAVHSAKQRTLLLGYLGQRLKAAGLPADLCPVEIGMRYGGPSMAAAVQKLVAGHCDRILVLPLYPQYAASVTASTFDEASRVVRRERKVPGLRFVAGFHDDPGYIRALARHLNDEWMKHGRPDHFVLSFHGIPQRSVARGDPYADQCRRTAALLVRELGLDDGTWTLSFQSRFGRARWLEPYTAGVLEALGRQRTGRVDVFCPGFVADCLETLEEIGIEGRDTFRKAGGGELRLIPCLNEHPAFLAALTDLTLRELGGWLPAQPAASRAATQTSKGP